MSGYISHGAPSNTGCSYAKVNSAQGRLLEDKVRDLYGVIGYLQYTDCATGQIKHKKIGLAVNSKVSLDTSPVYNAKLPRFMMCKWTEDGGGWIDCRT